MNIKIIQKFDKAYYEEFYKEWLSFRSTQKKWQDKIGVAALVFAIIIYFFVENFKLVSIGLAIFGIMMIYEFYSTKKQWLNARLKSPMNNQTATILFETKQIQTSGVFSTMSGEWEEFNNAIETEKGIFLILENQSIYLQKSSFDNPNDITKIVQKIKIINAK